MKIFTMTKTVSRNLVTGPATLMYPQRERSYSSHHPGAGLKTPSTGASSAACAPNGVPPMLSSVKENKAWQIDRLKCCICNLCVDVCPVKCLATDNHYASSVTAREMAIHEERQNCPPSSEPAGGGDEVDSLDGDHFFPVMKDAFRRPDAAGPGAGNAARGAGTVADHIEVPAGPEITIDEGGLVGDREEDGNSAGKTSASPLPGEMPATTKNSGLNRVGTCLGGWVAPARRIRRNSLCSPDLIFPGWFIDFKSREPDKEMNTMAVEYLGAKYSWRELKLTGEIWLAKSSHGSIYAVGIDRTGVLTAGLVRQ